MSIETPLLMRYISINFKKKFKENNKMKEERFEKVYSQGRTSSVEIWVDKQTGVNYLFHRDGYAGGLTVLLNAEGKPVVTSVN